MLRIALRILVVLAVIAAVVGGGFWLVQQKQRALSEAPKYGMQPTPVRVGVARRGALVRKRGYLAVVQPVRVANVSARLTATVEKVLHYENEPVKAGDVLVILDGRQVEESIASMKAQVEQAQADLASNQATAEALAKTAAYWEREAQRDKTLSDKGTIPPAQAEGTADKADEARGQRDASQKKSSAIESLIESLRRKQAELETQLSYCTIRSPFDGLVSHRLVDPGDLATPGKVLMEVEDRRQLKLCFDVPQQDLPEVREGLAVRFAVNGQDRKATLSHLFPSLNLARMLRAEVYLRGPEAEGLSSGAYVPLGVVLGETKDAVLVPASSLVESPDRKPCVFVVRDGQLEARPVNVVGSSGDDVAVEGLEAGQEVVLSTFLGWATLSSGQKVEVMR
jgi:RND family efflux transporter MFP subunit